MEIIKWEPFRDIDRFFGDKFLQPFSSFQKIGLDLAVDVYEEKGNVVAKMSLPGIKVEELDISVEDEALTISGRREEERETDKKDYYSKEIRRGSFARTVGLPKTVDAGKAEAMYENGELVIKMPVIPGKKEKAIKIKVKK